MFTLKHLKTFQHISIIIQIIFRELVCSLLKLLILKFVKNVKVNVVMRQRNIWCVCVCSVWRGMLDCQSSIPLHTERHAHAHTHTQTHTRIKCYAAASPHWLFTFLTNFKISDFNKEHRAPWRWSEWWSKYVGAFFSVLMWTNILLYIEVH